MTSEDGTYYGTTGATWVRWCASTGTSSTVWATWNFDSSGTTSGITVFGSGTYVSGETIWDMWNTWPQLTAVEETAEAREARIHEEQEANLRQATLEAARLAERAERELKERQANARADALLLSLLNRRQRKEYAKTKSFSIYQRGRRHPTWVLKSKPSYNLEELDGGGKVIKRHCVQTPLGIPLADQLATQLLYINAGYAEDLLRVANHQVA